MWDALRSLLCKGAPVIALLAVWGAARWERELDTPFSDSFYIAPDGEVIRLYSTMAHPSRAREGRTNGLDPEGIVAVEQGESAG